MLKILYVMVLGQLSVKTDMWECQYRNGHAWCSLGILYMNLLSPRGPVDPVYMKKLLKQYAEKEVSY